MKRLRPSRSRPAVIRLSSYRPSDLNHATAPRTTRIPSFNNGRTRRIRASAPAFIAGRPTAPPDQPDGVLRLVLPIPPSINHHYATVNGRRVLSAEGRRFKTLVGREVICALAKRKAGRRFLAVQNNSPLALDLRFYFASELRRDIDGGLKITQDAVCEALGINDNRIVEVTLRKDRDAVTPRMELALRAAGPAPPTASTT